MTTNMYRTIFSGIIRQKSALSVGGSESDSSSSKMFRDGNGRLTIPATSVAGAFVETAMRIFPEIKTDKKADIGNSNFLWEHITGKKAKGKSTGDIQSAFSFENIHLVYENACEMRQGVGINAFTGTSADSSLFSTETVPAGNKWYFYLEVDTARTGRAGEYVAALVLDEWAKGYGWIGKDNARGCGWFEMSDIDVVSLSFDNDTDKMKILEQWPNSEKSFGDALKQIKDQPFAKGPDFDDLVRTAKKELANKLNKDWHYIKLSYSIEPGLASDGYGFDIIQSGGHAAIADFNLDEEVLSNMLTPPCTVDETSKNAYRNNIEPDKPFPMTYDNESGKYRPFIPGSSIRGSFRSVTSKIKRGENKRKDSSNNDGFWGVLDPNCKKKLNAGQYTIGELENLFGVAIQKSGDSNNNNDDVIASRILFSDAILENNSNYSLLQLEQHAEDEFCASVYGTGKFDSCFMIGGKLSFDIVLEGPNKDVVMNDYKIIHRVLSLAEKGWVPVGGGVFKGAGWIKWNCINRTIRQIACQEEKLEVK